MGVVVTIMNMKGGVGKTTVSAHLAGITCRYLLGNKPRKVLVIDYDPQFNLSQAFLPPKTYFALEKDRKTILPVLLDDDINLDPYKLQVPGNHNPPKVKDLVTRIYDLRGAHLDLLPSTLDLMYVALGQANGNTEPIEERFSKFIDECKLLYDVIYIDCHPAGSLFTKTSLRNSDHVVIPVVPQRSRYRADDEFHQLQKGGTCQPRPASVVQCHATSWCNFRGGRNTCRAAVHDLLYEEHTEKIQSLLRARRRQRLYVVKPKSL
jgi:chromosome partitioning protein